MVRGGGFRKICERFLLSACEGWRCWERRESRERLWAKVNERRSVARRAAVTSGDGGSPKMKNLIKAPRMSMIDS